MYEKNNIKKCLNYCIVSKGMDSINEMLDYALQFEGEPKRVINKIVKYNLYLIAHKSSGFDSYVVLNNLPQWRTVSGLNKDQVLHLLKSSAVL